MQLMIGKILVLTGVISLGSGIAYVTFQRMPADDRAAAGDQLAKAIDVAERSGATPPQDVQNQDVPNTEAADSDSQSPFALSEPTAEDSAAEIADSAEAVPAAESRTAFLFEVPENANTVTPVSFTTPATDEKSVAGDEAEAVAIADAPTGAQPAPKDEKSSRESLLFFGAGEAAGAASKSNPRSSGGSTSRTGAASGVADLTAPGSSDAAEASVALDPTGAGSLAADADAPAQTPPQPRTRNAASPADSLFFSGNPAGGKQPASAKSSTKSTARTASTAAKDPLLSRSSQTPARTAATGVASLDGEPQPRPRSSTAGTAMLDPTDSPRPEAPAAPAEAVAAGEAAAEPFFPALEEPAVESSAGAAPSPSEDLPFMRSFDDDAESEPATLPAADSGNDAGLPAADSKTPEKPFNPFEPVDSAATATPAASPQPAPAKPAASIATPPLPAADESAAASGSVSTPRPTANPQPPTPPIAAPSAAESNPPEPLFPELSVPPAVPTLPADRPATGATATPSTVPSETTVTPPEATPTGPDLATPAAPSATPAPAGSALPGGQPAETAENEASPFDELRAPMTPSASADLPVVPLPAEPRPFSPDTESRTGSERRAVEDLRSLPGRSGAPTNSTAEPFPIERGGSPSRVRSGPGFAPPEPAPMPAEPEPFPLTDEPSQPDAPGESRPLPPFEELPSRTGGGGAASVPDRDSDRGSPPSPIRAVEKLRPQLTIEKKSPESATIGIAHEYRITVSNDGDTAARDVVVEDELNGAAEFLSSNPPADYDATRGVILWTVDELQPMESREIVVRVRPTGEGMLTGTATVRFRTEVRSATLIRAPKLQLEIDSPKQVLVGEDVRLRFTIRNAGSGDAAGVLLRSVLPDAIRHPEGADLEYGIDLLRAGDEQTVDLTVVAAEPGRPVRISAEISAAGIPPVVARSNLSVIGSQLIVERMGPAKRFVGRPARFQNVVINQTDFEASEVTITEDVPEGMRVLAVGSGGEYNPKTRRITWQVPKINAGEQTVLEVELQPESTGRMESVVEVLEKAGFRSRAEENTVVEVEGLHNVTADITRQDQPVAVGERFGFTVAVDNRGTAVARNVELTIQVPAGLQVLAAGTRDIPGRLLPGNIVRYSIVRSLKPGEQLPFQVTLQGREAVRNAVIQAQLKYDEMTQPLIISESVTVFDDQP